MNVHKDTQEVCQPIVTEKWGLLGKERINSQDHSTVDSRSFGTQQVCSKLFNTAQLSTVYLILRYLILSCAFVGRKHKSTIIFYDILSCDICIIINCELISAGRSVEPTQCSLVEI